MNVTYTFFFLYIKKRFFGPLNYKKIPGVGHKPKKAPEIRLAEL
ncbi:hypothetical protein Lepil_0553 [Leptonema illini DSM 21528]|uniref:Uncharacterized protein n=1 Tax=Leptonema illini DSM 21528 TaxID=929563 RepID=H2CC28_9LEPT|nr:hypothetical protein Lepil_0553 [Leptonema illini DSM 21528]